MGESIQIAEENAKPRLVVGSTCIPVSGEADMNEKIRQAKSSGEWDEVIFNPRRNVLMCYKFAKDD